MSLLSKILDFFIQRNEKSKRDDLLFDNQKRFLSGFDNLLHHSPAKAANVVKFLANTIQGQLFSRAYFYDRGDQNYIGWVQHSILPGNDRKSQEVTLEVNIKDTPVVSCIWNYDRLFSCLLGIGGSSGNPFDGKKNENNISAEFLLPLNFVIVTNGNHSTNSAIINNEGALKIKNVVQMDSALEKYYFDGIHYREIESNRKIHDDFFLQASKPILYEFGLLFEIARIYAGNKTSIRCRNSE